MVPKLHEKNRKKAMHPTETEQLLMKCSKSPTHCENIGELRKSIYTLAGEFPCNTDLRKKGTWSGNKKAGSPPATDTLLPIIFASAPFIPSKGKQCCIAAPCADTKRCVVHGKTCLYL